MMTHKPQAQLCSTSKQNSGSATSSSSRTNTNNSSNNNNSWMVCKFCPQIKRLNWTPTVAWFRRRRRRRLWLKICRRTLDTHNSKLNTKVSSWNVCAHIKAFKLQIISSEMKRDESDACATWFTHTQRPRLIRTLLVQMDDARLMLLLTINQANRTKQQDEKVNLSRVADCFLCSFSCAQMILILSTRKEKQESEGKSLSGRTKLQIKDDAHLFSLLCVCVDFNHWPKRLLPATFAHH